MERSIKDLLIIVRDNLERLIAENKNNGGICAVISDLYFYQSQITQEELNALRNFMDNNIPECGKDRMKNLVNNSDDVFDESRHWWKAREVEPRVKWLNEQIDKL